MYLSDKIRWTWSQETFVLFWFFFLSRAKKCHKMTLQVFAVWRMFRIKERTKQNYLFWRGHPTTSLKKWIAEDSSQSNFETWHGRAREKKKLHRYVGHLHNLFFFLHSSLLCNRKKTWMTSVRLCFVQQNATQTKFCGLVN